jgi:DNA-binding Lrp family transcriptional regulator
MGAIARGEPVQTAVFSVAFPSLAWSSEREVQMATKAFILVETAVGKTKDVIAAIQKLDGVKSVDMVTGPYDLVVVAELADLNSVGDLVTGSIHPIPGITRTVTCLAVRPT